MPAPTATPSNFLGILENVWWRLDIALDLDMIDDRRRARFECFERAKFR